MKANYHANVRWTWTSKCKHPWTWKKSAISVNKSVSMTTGVRAGHWASGCFYRTSFFPVSRSCWHRKEKLLTNYKLVYFRFNRLRSEFGPDLTIHPHVFTDTWGAKLSWKWVLRLGNFWDVTPYSLVCEKGASHHFWMEKAGPFQNTVVTYFKLFPHNPLEQIKRTVKKYIQ
jgi:hypothetical protein